MKKYDREPLEIWGLVLLFSILWMNQQRSQTDSSSVTLGIFLNKWRSTQLDYHGRRKKLPKLDCIYFRREGTTCNGPGHWFKPDTVIGAE